MVFLLFCVIYPFEGAAHFVYQLLEQLPAFLGIQFQPAVHDVQLGQVGQDGRQVKVMEGFQGTDLFPAQLVQGPFAGENVRFGQGQLGLGAFFKFSAVETVYPAFSKTARNSSLVFLSSSTTRIWNILLPSFLYILSDKISFFILTHSSSACK